MAKKENKKTLIDLINQIDQKKQELKQLKKDYKTAFNEVTNSWRKEIKSLYPQLKSCNIGEYVGMDVTLNGKVYNIFISEHRQKLFCMFSLDRKDKNTALLKLQNEMNKEDFEKLKLIFCDPSLSKGTSFSSHNSMFVYFKKEEFDKAYQFFFKVLSEFSNKI